MNFRDRLRAWFKGQSTGRSSSKPTVGPSDEAVRQLEEFFRSRTGVEGYLEPRTTLYSTTLLLVAADGEYLRRPIKGRQQAEKVCRKHGAPLYEAAKVGYPQRMRDYKRGVQRNSVNLEDLPPWPGNDDGT